jgi:hypothetical protein
MLMDIWFSPLLHWLTRKRNWVRTHGSVSQRAVNYVGSPFSGAVTLSNSVGGSWKVATYGDRPQEAYAGRTWTGVESVRVVLIEFSPTGCTSIQITGTLGYE